MSNKLPLYIINPATTPTAWQGPTHGLHIFPNANWLNSVWLGTAWNFLSIPDRAWSLVLKPLLLGLPVIAIIGFAYWLLSIPVLFIAGLFSFVKMLPYPEEVFMDARVMGYDEARRAIQHGWTAPLFKLDEDQRAKMEGR